ncbi:MAG TPA: hypothetical protein P5567_09570 [Kiritimatiellia bacterium]|nr:hypothetical protein [Kiritimatiellia bacterium]HRZ12689.1 hypothetical protein [Kiritimatiellia bacterium]HSA19543.1 hypothetical protein [Kiritimatiellia bacterium]
MRIALALVVGLFVCGMVMAQEVAAPVAAAEQAVTKAAAATETAAEQVTAAAETAVETVASTVESAQVITLKGRVSVVKEADGSVRAIYINPEAGHGYKVDLKNGEGMTLADKHGKVVEVTGADVNMLFQVKTITVVE